MSAVSYPSKRLCCSSSTVRPLMTKLPGWVICVSLIIKTNGTCPVRKMRIFIDYKLEAIDQKRQ